MLARFWLTEFHATDFHGRLGAFSKWNDKQAAELEMEAVRLLDKWEVKHSAALVVNDDYEKSFVETGFNKKIVPACQQHTRRVYFRAPLCRFAT